MNVFSVGINPTKEGNDIMKTYQRHMCYCLSVLVVCIISIICIDSNALIHLSMFGLVFLFGLIMTLLIIPFFNKRGKQIK